VKLCEYGGILHHGAQTADQPWEIRHEVLLLGGMTEYASAVCSVAHQGQNEE
jgi:hypothetical protein